MEFINATVIYGETRVFDVSIQERNETNTGFVPFDLSDCAIYFRILGSATANAKPLVEKLINQTTDEETIGQITDPVNGQFSFAVSAEDTVKVGRGSHPIQFDIVDIDTLEHRFFLGEGGVKGEFNKIYVVQV